MSTTAFHRSNYSGYLVLDRDLLLRQLAGAGVSPVYGRVVAEHITFAYPDLRPAPRAREVRVVGHAHADGVQALLVEVDGTVRRPDGVFFHLTYSLDGGHAPMESKAMLAAADRAGTITAVDPIAVAVARF